MRFELYKDKAGEHRWRLRHSNGNLIATASEGYGSKVSAMKSIENVQNSGKADIVTVK